MLKLGSLLTRENDEDSYRGTHEAPRNDGWAAPLYDLTKLYPDDIYDASTAAQYYGHGEPSLDRETIAIIQSARGKPNKPIKIYRAVPSIITTGDKIRDILLQKAYILKKGKLPSGVNTHMDKSSYYDWLDNELQKLKALPPSNPQQKITINKGDWITINRAYAVQHGRSTLQGKYRILSKTVPAKHIFTDANSIHEFGYDPS